MKPLVKLKEFRTSNGLNQREIAKKLNMSQTNYCKLETGKSQPNAKQILTFCSLFQCSPNDLFGFRGVHTIVADELE